MNNTDNLFGKLEKLHSRGVLSPDNNGSPQIEQRPSQNKQSELFQRSSPKIKNNSYNFSSILGTSLHKSETKENS
jgi:hypothetical protein